MLVLNNNLRMDSEMLNRHSLKDMFGNTLYQRGLTYYNQGRVRNLIYSEEEGIWLATVYGSKHYHVELEFLQDEIAHFCDCPAHSTYDQCKHIVAVALEVLDELQDQPKKEAVHHLLDQMENTSIDPETKELTTQMIKLFSSFVGPSEKDETISPLSKKPLKCEYYLKIDEYAWSPFITLEMKIGEERLYVVKKLSQLVQHVKKNEELEFTKNFIFDPKVHYFEEEDQEIINILMELNESESFFRKQSWSYGSNRNQKGMMIPPIFLERLLTLLKERNCHLEIGRKKFNHIDLVQGNLPFTFQLDKYNENNFYLDLHFLNDTHLLHEYQYLLKENTFYQLSQSQYELIKEMETIVNESHNRTLPIPRQQINDFLSYVIPGLKKIGDLKIAEEISNDIIQPSLQAKLYLDLVEGRLFANLEYHYGDYIFYPFGIEQEVPEDQILIRDVEREQEIMNLIEMASFKYNGYQLYIEDEDDMFTFLFDILPKLELVDVFMTNQVKSMLLEDRQYPKVQVNLDERENFLEINFDFDDIDPEEVENIFRSLTERKRYYRLPNGAFVPLEEEEFAPISKLFKELNIKPNAIENGQLTLPAYRSMQVESFINRESGAKYNKAFRKLITDIKNPEEQEFPIPKGLQADLREYQYVGFQWLKTLSHYKFGGILADDMGLGKTLQTITYLLSEHEEQENLLPALVISPASLIYNWKAEFEKFAPSLRVEVINGTKEERSQLIEQAEDVDVFVTSYPLIRQDINMYQQMEFSSLILDEAQAIKNSATKTAQAVKAIRAGIRFALSGTPIENSLQELWSIFDAILPGFFPSKKAFTSLPEEQISRMSRPFILRRLKQDVLKELPDKIETVHVSELTKEQKQLYVGYLERIQGEAADAIATEGFQKSRMKILAGLTRLRQLCCHPSLFIENYYGESGKLNQLLEMVENALENKQRILIFSQFASMLKMIREVLQQNGIDPFYLDGQTPSIERVDMANRFNNGEKDIFLISLKAGGTGLNLTGADTVILYDLWWNPAVEEQATGRAHRIGQKKVVQVMRLIAKGTIEEKIYSLQQKKKELIEKIIQPGETMFNSLTEEDIRELLNV